MGKNPALTFDLVADKIRGLILVHSQNGIHRKDLTMMELNSLNFLLRVVLLNALATSAGAILLLAAAYYSRKSLAKVRRNQN